MNELAIDARRRLGKKDFDTFLTYYNKVGGRHGRYIQTWDDFFAYVRDSQEFVRSLASQREVTSDHPDFGLTEEEIATNFIFRHELFLLNLSLMKSWETGDFSYCHQGLVSHIRYDYASNLYLDLKRNFGYGSGSGLDHGAKQSTVLACYACLRPDFAKQYFPEQLGLVKHSYPAGKITSNLIISLLHNRDDWKAASLTQARKFLQGKRQAAEAAIVAYLIGLCEQDVAEMSNQLEILAKNYKKANWLQVPGGKENAISLYGLYFMGKFYLDGDLFAELKRPSAPFWWDEYADLCLTSPLPEKALQPEIVFPSDLDFLNKAYYAIEEPIDPAKIFLALDRR